MNRHLKAHSLVAIAATCALAGTACGEAHRQTTDAERRQVATAFVRAIVRQRDVAAAMRLVAPNEINPDLVQGLVSDSANGRLRIVAGPLNGCSKSPYLGLPSGPCFRFRVRGAPVPDTEHPGHSTVAFGTIFVVVRAKAPPGIVATAFGGGGTEVKSPPD